MTGPFNWDGGTLQGVAGRGSLTVESDMILNGTHFIRDFDLINAGDASWTGGTVQFYGDSSFTNADEGTFEIRVDGTFGSFDNRCIRFNNDGLLRKTAGTGITHLNVILFNGGTVLIEQGQIQLSCGYVHSGPGDPPGPGDGIIYPPGEDDGGRDLPDDEVVVVSSYRQLVTGVLTAQISGHTPPGEFGIPGTDYGQLVVFGSVDLNGTLRVELLNGFVPGAGQKFKIIDNRGSATIDGAFAGLEEGDTISVGPHSFTISYLAGAGNNDVVLTSSAWPSVELSGRVFDDRDNDGQFDGEDTGIGSVVLSLFTEDMGIATTVTDDQGQYSFAGNFAAGTYRIVASQNAGFLDGKETAGTLGGVVTNAEDSNTIHGIVLRGGDVGRNYDFAEIQRLADSRPGLGGPRQRRRGGRRRAPDRRRRHWPDGHR